MSDITETPKVSRRLAAILAADIAGYSTLMGADEARTVHDLKEHQAVVLPMVGQYRGRVIDTAGDGILAEFASVVNAVECAVAIQKIVSDRNFTVDPARQMHFRIGINVGDVIHDDVRLYGDGVNIAARLEAIAEPGEICISGTAYDQVRRKLPLMAINLGSQPLKNIGEPVDVYRVEAQRPADVRSLRPPLALPDKSSIAVLPFANISSDKDQDYFCDGITEDIITELSRLSELFVIARNSSFQYKGKSADSRVVGRELGVHYVLEGSIRRVGDRVRIAAQLIDTRTGAHRWAERYDRTLEDVFAVQDEVARSIVAILAVHVRKAETERTRRKPPNSWQAHDYYLQAIDAFNDFTASLAVVELYETRRLLRLSLATDPNYARSYAVLAFTYSAVWLNRVDSDFLAPAALDKAHQFARESVGLDPHLP